MLLNVIKIWDAYFSNFIHTVLIPWLYQYGKNEVGLAFQHENNSYKSDFHWNTLILTCNKTKLAAAIDHKKTK